MSLIEAPLLHAIFSGDLATLRALAPTTDLPGLRSPQGKTLLYAAAEAGHPQIVEFLLAAGCDATAQGSEGEAPLHAAACGQPPSSFFIESPAPWDAVAARNLDDVETPVLQLLRQRGVAMPDSFAAIDDLPNPPRSQLYDVVLDLVGDAARLHRELISADIPFDATAPFFRFVRHSYPDYPQVADLLIAHGAEVNLLDARGWAPLHYATTAAMAELLVHRGANVILCRDPSDPCCCTPLTAAIDRSNVAVADVLHRHGAPIEFDTAFPVHTAANNGRLEILLWLLDAGADLNQRNPTGDTPLLCAAHGHVEVLEPLLARGADVRLTNDLGQGVLHLSVNWTPALRLFLPYNLDVNAPDRAGLTPLHYAARGAAEETIPLLLDAGADVNAQDHDGNTPLHIIFFSHEFRPDIEFPTFEALVAGGADRTIQNKQGETAFALAQKFAYPQPYLDLLQPP